MLSANEAVIVADVRQRHAETERHRRGASLQRLRKLDRRAQRAARRSQKASAAALAQAARMQ